MTQANIWSLTLSVEGILVELLEGTDIISWEGRIGRSGSKNDDNDDEEEEESTTRSSSDRPAAAARAVRGSNRVVLSALFEGRRAFFMPAFDDWDRFMRVWCWPSILLMNALHLLLTGEWAISLRASSLHTLWRSRLQPDVFAAAACSGKQLQQKVITGTMNTSIHKHLRFNLLLFVLLWSTKLQGNNHSTKLTGI